MMMMMMMMMMMIILMMMMISDDDDDDEDDAINTLRLRHYETFYRHFATRLPEGKCKKR